MTPNGKSFHLHAACAVFALACLGTFGCAKSTSRPGLPGTDEIEKLCVHFTTCSLTSEPPSATSMTYCVQSLVEMQLASLGYVDYSGVYNCAIAAGSNCDEIVKCFNGGHALEPCDEASFEDRCDGDMTVICEFGDTVYFDCNRLIILIDPQCIDHPEEGITCASPCTEDYARCYGNVLEICDTSEAEGAFRWDCGAFGMSCEAAEGWATCLGRPCESNRCDEDAIVWCSEGSEARIDCAELIGSDYTCFMDPDEGEPDCVPKGTQCDSEDYADTCEGPVLTFCRAGYIGMADCRSYGYSGCVQGVEAGGYPAHCQ
jgi:hypothetical protein